MNKLFRNLLALTLAFLMLALCSGCQTAVVKPRPFNANFEILSVDKEIVAENESFILAWESEYKRILLKDRVTVMYGAQPLHLRLRLAMTHPATE